MHESAMVSAILARRSDVAMLTVERALARLDDIDTREDLARF